MLWAVLCKSNYQVSRQRIIAFTSKLKSWPKPRAHKEVNMLAIKVHKKVHIHQPLLGKVPIVSFMDYNLKKVYQFLEYRFNHYADTNTFPDGFEDVILKPWARKLFHSDNLALLDVPHFGSTPIISTCSRFILSRLHCGFLWLDKNYPVNPETMHRVSGLPRAG